MERGCYRLRHRPRALLWVHVMSDNIYHFIKNMNGGRGPSRCQLCENESWEVIQGYSITIEKYLNPDIFPKIQAHALRCYMCGQIVFIENRGE